MSTLTIQEAAETTGWSPRMLRYIEQVGLVAAPRSPSGYRLYGPAELQRLRTLRELLQRFDIGLTDVGFALRLRRDDVLRSALDEWFIAEPAPPADVSAADWLRFEQQKHQKLLSDIPVAQHSRPATLDTPTGAFPVIDLPDDTGTFPLVTIPESATPGHAGLAHTDPGQTADQPTAGRHAGDNHAVDRVASENHATHRTAGANSAGENSGDHDVADNEENT